MKRWKKGKSLAFIDYADIQETMMAKAVKEAVRKLKKKKQQEKKELQKKNKSRK